MERGDVVYIVHSKALAWQKGFSLSPPPLVLLFLVIYHGVLLFGAYAYGQGDRATDDAL